MPNREEALRKIFDSTWVSGRLTADQKRELLAHLEDAVEAKVGAGVPEMDAVGQAFAELGDLHAGIDDAVWDIEPLLEWSARDEKDRGLGDAPYPPNYPKQEGEPPRVQPSKKVAAHWDEHGNRVDPTQSGA